MQSHMGVTRNIQVNNWGLWEGNVSGFVVSRRWGAFGFLWEDVIGLFE